MNEIREADSLAAMVDLPSAAFDAIVMDPPYCAGAVSEASRTRSRGQGLRSENLRRFGWFTGDNMGTAGLAFLLRSIAFEGLRIVKPTGHLLCFCDWRMQATLAPAIESSGWRYQGLIVWDKGSMGLGNGFRAQHELVLHFTAGAPEYHDRATANVLQAKRVRASDRQHQTEKPLELLRRLIRVVSPKGGSVLDPFCGSGSTGVACVLEGRDFLGIERDAEFVAVSRARIAGARIDLDRATEAQRTIFDELEARCG